MANYLMPAGNLAPISAPARTRDDIISVNNMYRMKLYNNAGTVKFEGFIPPEFSITLSSAWNSPYANTSLLELGSTALGNAASAGMKVAGGSSMMKAASAQVWQGPSYLDIDLPVFLDAYSDTQIEVVNNVVELLSLGAPSEGIGGILIPPGPAPLSQVANEVTGTEMLDSAEAFHLDIGNFFSMSPAVINNVTAAFDNVMEDGTGNPLTCDFVLQVRSYFAVTREDLRKWFKVTTSTVGA